VDLAAGSVAPFASHPVRIIAAIRLKSPDQNGFRTREELPVVSKVEDAIVDALEKERDAIFVARTISEGISSAWLYAPAATTREQVSSLCQPLLGEYQVVFIVENDPSWEAFEEALYPDPYSMQSIQNRRVVTQLKENGDRLEVPRQIDHFAYFPDEAKAVAATGDLRALGYVVDAPKPNRDEYGVSFKRTESLQANRMDPIIAELYELIVEKHGGHYDGWGCAVQR
jgi:regulator of RNase E activity RraB